MSHTGARNHTRGTSLASRLILAGSWWGRLRGLLGRPPLRRGEGLLLRPCRSVHTLGLGYPIDVLFLAADGRVVAMCPSLPPRRVTRHHRDALATLELPAGVIQSSGTLPGDQVALTGGGFTAAEASTPRAAG